MLTQQTLEKMNAMKLSAMVEAFEQQLGSGEHAKLSFEERLGLLIDCEWTAREQRKLTRRLRVAKPRYKSASLEDVDFKHPRGLNRQQVLGLASCSWIQDQNNLLITGPTGIGKSFLACAFVERACRRGFTARYVRMPRLLHEIAVGDSHALVRTRLRMSGLADRQCEWLAAGTTVRCTLVGRHHAAGIEIRFDGPGDGARVTGVWVREPVYTGPFHLHARLRRGSR